MILFDKKFQVFKKLKFWKLEIFSCKVGTVGNINDLIFTY